MVQRLDGIFGVGHVTATAFVGEYSHNVARFADARQFAANIGITPSEHSNGEKRRLGAITKRGNPYLRKLLVQCAQAVVNAADRRDDAICHRSEEHTSELQSLMRISYAVFCLKKQN